MANFPSGVFVGAPDLNAVTFDTGDVKWSARRAPTSGWFGPCRGDEVSRATYADLFDAIVPLLGTFTVTIASPGVFTLGSHGLVIGDRVFLTTTGALPTGLAANTIYYVVSVPTANTFTVSATEGGAAINTTGSQSSVHSLNHCPHGLGDGSTTFNVPDGAGRSLVGSAGASGHVSVRAQGQSEGVALANRAQKHNATVVQPTISAPTITVNGAANVPEIAGATLQLNSGVSNARLATITATASAPIATGGTVGPGGTLPVDQPANLVLNLFIKT